MKNKSRILATFFVLVTVIVLSGCGCKQKTTHLYDLSLEVWGTLDREVAFRDAFENYKKINPNISSIVYKKISADTYKKELLDALASGQGPDIFFINNAWVPSFQDKIVGAPIDQKIINEQKFKNNFVDVAADDFILDGKIYAVPLTVNTLGLFYNKDLFNQAGITSPPRDWNEFIADVIKLTRIDDSGNIIQSGAAIGTAYNINRSTDILNLLMMQNGTKMIDDQGKITFDKSVFVDGKNIFPGENALNFYTQFGKSGSINYTWNNDMHYSIDAFSEGQTAMMFNYSWNIQTVLDKSPKLNFAVAQVPQFENGSKINFANYQGLAVVRNKIPQSAPYGGAPAPNVSNETRIKEAWAFLTYLTTQPDGTFVGTSGSSTMGKVTDPNFDPAKSYLIKSNEPAARRDLIELQKTDPNLGVFAKDNLIAKSWRRIDSASTEAIFGEMIDQINRGQTTVSEALKTAATRVQSLSK